MSTSTPSKRRKADSAMRPRLDSPFLQNRVHDLRGYAFRIEGCIGAILDDGHYSGHGRPDHRRRNLNRRRTASMALVVAFPVISKEDYPAFRPVLGPHAPNTHDEWLKIHREQ